MSSKKSKERRQNEQLKLENAQLKATLHAAHDHLHNNRLDALHETLHCDSCVSAEQALNGQNITVADSGNLMQFMETFNELCAKHAMQAAATAFVPSATVPGATSIQMGGSVEVIQWLRGELGMQPTHAIGSH